MKVSSALRDCWRDQLKLTAQASCDNLAVWRRRHSSAVAAPASCSFKIPMICSSLNLLRFIRPYFAGADSTEKWRHFRGARHSAKVVSGDRARRLYFCLSRGAEQMPVDAEKNVHPDANK